MTLHLKSLPMKKCLILKLLIGKKENDFTDILNQLKTMVNDCTSWKEMFPNKYASMHTSINMLELWFNGFLNDFNDMLWKSELHLVTCAYYNPITRKRFFSLFENNNGEPKKLSQFLGLFTASYLAAIMMVCNLCVAGCV